MRLTSTTFVLVLLTAGVAAVAWGKGHPEPPPKATQIVLRVGAQPATEQLSAGGEFRLYTLSGQPAGTAVVTYVQTLAIPFSSFHSAILTLKLRGGTIVAEAGSSLTGSDSGPPFYADPTSRCTFDTYFGGPEYGGVLSCSGPITRSTGAYAGESGRVSYDGRFDGNELEGWLTWTLPPTITVDLD